MKASYYRAAVAVALGTLTGAARLCAADPAAGVLLLDDFRVVEGTVERFGKLYRVTANGKTELVNERQVLHRAATRADVYQFVTDRADTETAAGRARLAAWFLKVGVPDRAAIEAKAAAELAPGDAKLTDLVARCEAAALAPRVAPPATAAPLPAPPPVVLPAAAPASGGLRISPRRPRPCSGPGYSRS